LTAARGEGGTILQSVIQAGALDRAGIRVCGRTRGCECRAGTDHRDRQFRIVRQQRCAPGEMGRHRAVAECERDARHHRHQRQVDEHRLRRQRWNERRRVHLRRRPGLRAADDDQDPDAVGLQWADSIRRAPSRAISSSRDREVREQETRIRAFVVSRRVLGVPREPRSDTQRFCQFGR